MAGAFPIGATVDRKWEAGMANTPVEEPFFKIRPFIACKDIYNCKHLSCYRDNTVQIFLQPAQAL
jgi:hypothetical protein